VTSISNNKEKIGDSYQFIVVEKIERIALITVHRPKALNALNRHVIAELQSAVDVLEQDQEVRVIIVTGDDRAFVAGADIKEMHGLSVTSAYETARAAHALHNTMILSTKPVIAAISGYCLGGGMELALACDIRIAGRNAVFGLPEIKLGIIPGGGGTQRLLSIVGPAVASHLIFTGDSISAERAYELNLVSEIADDPKAAAIELASRLAAGSKTALTAAKRLLQGQIQKALDNRLQLEVDEFARLFDQPGSLEGMTAFMEKRKPQFK